MKIFAGQVLKELRKKNQLTQKNVAEYLHVSRPTYERYEMDSVEIPLSKLCAIAALYKIEPIDLVGNILNTEVLIAVKDSRNSKIEVSIMVE